ncbi:MAG: hypothetical protein LBQ09_06255 [Acidobacteriaceae bacterium]|nr:hypothetical protein [Acidobacteriaceae bacterium]
MLPCVCRAAEPGGFCDVRVEAARSGWDAEAAPADGWVNVTLPDQWTAHWPNFDGVVWYRLSFDGACAHGQPLAAWIDFLNMAGAVYLNGTLLDRDRSLVEPLTRAWNMTRYMPLPAPLLKPDGNILLVRVSGIAAYQPGLGPTVIGDASAVRPLYDRAYRLRHDFQLYSMAVTLTLGCLFFIMWLLRRSERIFGWYALESFAWALVAVNQSATSTWPLASTDAWEAVNMIALIIYSASFTMFTLSFADRRLPRLQAALWLLTACQIIAMVVAPHAAIEPVRAVLMTMVVASVIITCVAFIAFALTSRRAEHLAMALCMMFFIVVGVHDWLEFLGLFSNNIYYSALASQVTMLAMALLLAVRFVESQWRIEKFNDELTAKIAAAQTELAETLGRQHKLEITNAHLHERLALAYDLHDGLGGTLINNIIALEQAPRDLAAERFLTVLRELRDDLQGIIEAVASESSSAASLAELIAPLRHRITQLFEARGIRCRWILPEAGDMRLHDVRVGADVMRLLQEGLTNALRHSGATHVEVTLAASGTTLALSIVDNGRGFDPHAGSAGLGLRSMRARAERLSGTFGMHSSDKGTTLSVTIPGVVSTSERGR